ncbi:MAG: glycosyltransferase [Phycisphaerae bacterium]|nr:glycosyltransferase [Phycisphaerae bacterium]
MKLLVLTNNPDRPSFRQRFRIYLNDLRNHGIECSVVRFPAGCAARYRLWKSAGAFDGVYLHKKRLNAMEAWCIRRYCSTLIYDFDDAVMFSDVRPDRRSITRYLGFRRTARRADVVIAGNEILAEYARRFNANVHVLPTGLDLNDYTARHDHGAPDNVIRLGWIGSASTLPYLASIRGVLEELGMRYPNVVLRVIGDRFLELKTMPVEECVWSLDTQASDLAACHIGLAPLPDDRFTRGKCGFKILQYAATGIPFVASGVGVNRIFAEQSQAGYIADSKEEWSCRLSRLIEDERLRSQLGQNGRRYVARFDAKTTGARLISILSNAIGTQVHKGEALHGSEVPI